MDKVRSLLDRYREKRFKHSDRQEYLEAYCEMLSTVSSLMVTMRCFDNSAFDRATKDLERSIDLWLREAA